MITVYFAGKGPAPESVECERPGYPNKDAQGRVMYENSHFRTEEEAWHSLLKNAEAGLRLCASALEDAQERVRQETERTAAAGLRLAKVMEAHKDWQRQRSTKP